MPARLRSKAILTALLAAALLAGGVDRLSSAVFLFGVLNVVVTPPGTTWVRLLAVLWAALALDGPMRGLEQVTLFLVWWAWPPAYLVSWALAGRAAGDADRAPGEGRPAAGIQHARAATAGLIAAVAAASLVYRYLTAHALHQTAALFVGIPALLAVAVVFLVSPKTAVGVACKAVTIGLLVSLTLLGEGMVCVAMSAPLFYGIAVLAGRASEALRRSGSSMGRATYGLALVALLPMSLEGTSDHLSFDRLESVTETRIVAAPADAVERALREAPRFGRPLPAYLAIGFPTPVATRIEEAGAESRWVVRFRGGEMRIDGLEPRDGDLVLRLDEARPGLLRWTALGDTSHMTHYLDWVASEVSWEPVDARTTRVTWTLRYRRGLDPAWYFGPWERYAMRLAAGYLIDAVATP